MVSGLLVSVCYAVSVGEIAACLFGGLVLRAPILFGLLFAVPSTVRFKGSCCCIRHAKISARVSLRGSGAQEMDFNTYNTMEAL